MKYLVDISQQHAKKIQSLVGKGDYEGIAQFITVAIENQLHLEESGLPVFAEDESGIDASIEENKLTKGESVPASLKLTKFHVNPHTIPLPSYKQLVLGRKEGKEELFWPWGQINKILPVKIGVRTLFRELAADKFMPIEEFANVAVEEAVRIGVQLRTHEDQLGKLRDERISAGLPKVDDEKSQTRYRAHFLAYGRKDGLLDGAMALFRFASINTEAEKHLIGITQAGIDFAKTPNPILDEENLDKSISRAEVDFYLAHVKNYVKGEFAGIKWVLTKIKQGINEREPLNSELKKEFAELWEASDAVINTQRAGVMARMFELGLLEKEKKGIYVTYHNSEFGKSFLAKI